MLRLCSLHRQVDHSSSSSAHLASVLEPNEFVSGECSSTKTRKRFKGYFSNRLLILKQNFSQSDIIKDPLYIICYDKA